MGRLAVLALLGCLVTLPARAARPEACLAASPATPAIESTCSYGPATVKGGVDAFYGKWKVVITRRTSHRKRTITIDPQHLPRGCETTGTRTICVIGTIKPGDRVAVRAYPEATFVGAGNPCPVPAPGPPPPILGGDC